MKTASLNQHLTIAIKAARAAGKVMRANWHKPKRVKLDDAHDIKLELDVRCQALIEKTLARAFPQIPVLGEEGDTGDVNAEYRWVIDPIDGTVNYASGLPHAGVSIASLTASNVSASREFSCWSNAANRAECTPGAPFNASTSNPESSASTKMFPLAAGRWPLFFCAIHFASSVAFFAALPANVSASSRTFGASGKSFNVKRNQPCFFGRWPVRGFCREHLQSRGRSVFCGACLT